MRQRYTLQADCRRLGHVPLLQQLERVLDVGGANRAACGAQQPRAARRMDGAQG
jgi:hypothetical protein